MKKIFISLLVCILLVGCGETEEDYNNEKDHEKFLIDGFSDTYEKELVIANKEDKGDSEYIYDVYLKEDSSFKFMACTYWEVSSAIPTRHYNWVTNYEDRYSNKVLESEFLSNPYGRFTYEVSDDIYSENCIMDSYKDIFILNSLSDIDAFAQFLYEIGQKEYLDSINLYVKYDDRTEPLLIKKEYNKNDYLEELNKLKG